MGLTFRSCDASGPVIDFSRERKATIHDWQTSSPERRFDPLKCHSLCDLLFAGATSFEGAVHGLSWEQLVFLHVRRFREKTAWTPTTCRGMPPQLHHVLKCANTVHTHVD